MRSGHCFLGYRGSVALMLLVGLIQSGCGPKFIVPGGGDKPAQVTVSAYTQDGCMEDLKEYAKENQLEVKLLKVESDLGWQILLFPFYKGYKCTGEAVSSIK